MSRGNDLFCVLPEMLSKYPESSHKAIVDTFCSMLEEGWDEEERVAFLNSGKGFSAVADSTIDFYMTCFK